MSPDSASFWHAAGTGHASRCELRQALPRLRLVALVLIGLGSSRRALVAVPTASVPADPWPPPWPCPPPAPPPQWPCPPRDRAHRRRGHVRGGLRHQDLSVRNHLRHRSCS